MNHVINLRTILSMQPGRENTHMLAHTLTCTHTHMHTDMYMHTLIYTYFFFSFKMVVAILEILGPAVFVIIVLFSFIKALSMCLQCSEDICSLCSGQTSYSES